jgi:hypothetical protein
MPVKRRTTQQSGLRDSSRLKLAVTFFFFVFLVLGYSRVSSQNPVFDRNIDQQQLLNNQYPLQTVLQTGGQFWTTPFTRYDKNKNPTGDGYGEGGADAPRASQRQAFNPSGFPSYPFLRLNGLDSQSCYECHNSIGSDPGYGLNTPLIRKQPSSVGGSAGSNSNAFINPCFPKLVTLFIRQPPHVFGSGYVQALGDEITAELYALRAQVRAQAQAKPNVPQSIRLVDTKHNLDYGMFTTTYKPGTPWAQTGNQSTCPPLTCTTPNTQASQVLRTLARPGRATRRGVAATAADVGDVMAPGFTDDLSQIKGISFDLIVRPFQWKGIASSLRHFVKDALDFHFSMQAVEKVNDCDCDKDGKTSEVSIGNVSAITSFVGMTRPPQQIVPPGVSNDSVQRGYQIFTNTLASVKLPQQMCATCHTPTLPIRDPNPQFIVDTPPTANIQCPKDCPQEATGNATSLISPVPSHAQLSVLARVKQALAPSNAKGATPVNYSIPLNSTDVPPSSLPRLTQTAPSFLPFVQPLVPGALNVPLFSDLHTHNMGSALQDLTAQGTDVSGVCVEPSFFLTRPLWGVADTGPWLHDGRATSLMDAILMHGDTASGSGSEAAPIIDAFEKLSDADKQNVVNFLLSLRLPVEQSTAAR